MNGDDEARFARGLAAAFLVVSVAKAFLHEPWRDEWGPWGVAADSASAADVIHAVRYSGHPWLWPLVVFALRRTIGGFVAVQMLTAFAATAAVWVVARFAPFPRWARALFACGYFPLFEYGSIARPYVLALLGACAAAALLRAARRRPLPFATVLFVLGQTSVYGVILAAAFGAAWLVDVRRAPRDERPSGAIVVAATTLVLAGFAAAALQMRPPADGSYAAEWNTSWDARRCLAALATVPRALLPLPLPRLHFWNTHVLDRLDAAGAALGAALVLLVAALAARRPAALALWLVAVVGQLAFTYLKYEGFARHHGHLFLAFVAARWTASDDDGVARRVVLGVVLAVQCAAGLFAVAMDAALPFSTAVDAAREIRVRGLDAGPIVGNRAATTSAVAAALGRPFVFAETGRAASFFAWDPQAREATVMDAARLAGRLAVERGAPVVLVLDQPFFGLPRNVERVAVTRPAVVRDESFAVYLVRP